MLPLYGAAVLLFAAQGVDAQGAKCDLASCTCGGVDLSSMKGKVYKAPQDAEGYAYSLSICGEIPKSALPSGCQQYAEHPSVVKYKNDNPADCIEIGSIGPCSQGECGMTGSKAAGGGVTVVYTYTYGCKNTFTLTLTPGSDPAPGQVTSNECSYTATWAGLAAAGLWVVTIPTFAIVGVGVAALAGGTGFNIKQRSMSGAEAVPFINFWRALPPLVMEGARFSFHHTREFSLMMYAKAMKKPYTAGPAYRPGEEGKSSSSSNPETAPINEVEEDVPDYGAAKE